MLSLPECRPFANHRVLPEAQWFIDHSPSEWPQRLELNRKELVVCAVCGIEWLMPDWLRAHPLDLVPVRAIEAARSHPVAGTDKLRLHARALAKACAASRRRSLGSYHRIAEAAKAVALASAATSGFEAAKLVGEAFAKVEEHALYAFSVAGTYRQEPAVREELLNRITMAM